jgi:uncharacterized protein
LDLTLETKQDQGEPAAAPHGGETAPERTCAVTRQTRAPEELIRFVLGPDLAVVPDIKRKLPGRGVWVGLSRALVARAVKKQVFARGLRDKAVASPDLPDLVESLLRRDALQGLSMANKAGIVTAGFAKVEAAIASGAVSALVHASDGAPDGKRKLRQALRRRFGDETPTEFELFATDELDSALGRGNVVHIALGLGPAAKVFLASARRLALYRCDGEAAGPDRGEDLAGNEALAQDREAQDRKADDANGRDTNGRDSWDA